MTFLLGVHFGTDQADSHTGGSGRDWIWGEAGDGYVLRAGAGDDFVYGGAGDDVIYGGAGNDVIYGGAGEDRITGAGDADVIYGGDGDDRINGGFSDGTKDRTTNFIDGGPGDDRIRGGSGNDMVLGGDGADFLNGATGNDTLVGGPGDDTLYGWTGDDVLTGGAGADIFEFRFQSPRGMGTDVITDFKDGEDLIYINTNGTLFTDPQKTALRDGIVYEGSATGYTGATIDLADAGATELSGVVHIVFDGTTTGLDADDFIWIDYFWSS